jgi:hypothetical protein
MPPQEENASGDSLRILALEPWLGGSHELFLEQWREGTEHELEVVGLPAHHWRWRMHSAPWQLARRLLEVRLPDVLLVSDYLDLPSLLGQLPPAWSRVPVVAYFHENQATYPLSRHSTPQDRERDRHLAWLNAMTVLRADRVLFNSEYHRQDFERAMDAQFRIWPKPNPRQECASRAFPWAWEHHPGALCESSSTSAGSTTRTPSGCSMPCSTSASAEASSS